MDRGERLGWRERGEEVWLEVGWGQLKEVIQRQRNEEDKEPREGKHLGILRGKYRE